ncbi:MAG TPA: hypothetical protein VFS43_04270 [Polyangiaceae bacterium]|nr:hypothetical protein [Polyangiaceae bacterium]
MAYELGALGHLLWRERRLAFSLPFLALTLCPSRGAARGSDFGLGWLLPHGHGRGNEPGLGLLLLLFWVPLAIVAGARRLAEAGETRERHAKGERGRDEPLPAWAEAGGPESPGAMLRQ